jgi:hypothetical protein
MENLSKAKRQLSELLCFRLAAPRALVIKRLRFENFAGMTDFNKFHLSQEQT